ncbi:hypothetical protein NUW58_g5251 [Xylaria curta]|uniref:Uncharacterized protein n=1 Tax=Xylaria curta TaxID=42375 RepID=A0ACC1P432_9PEZI|nr:hypothetical protein NUW58_g5251 [Xylaria curta]
MASNVFRMFSPENSKEDRAKKRKAQLRRAQLTYKERKERYAKNLEDRVADARSKEADLYREIQGLRRTVQQLTQFIQDHGMQVPDEILLSFGLSQVPESSTPSGWTPQQDYLPSVLHARDAMAPTNRLHPSLREEGRKAEATSDPGNLIRLGDLDPLAVGMEFVLTLESPCVNHLYPSPDKAHEPGGHALTVSGQLAPAYPKSVFESQTAHEVFCREVPEKSLHSLLTLSSELCPEYEITPVMAWHRIRSQPLFGGLEARNLWNLAEKLRDAATCHGFGAVIKQEFFERVIFETLMRTFASSPSPAQGSYIIHPNSAVYSACKSVWLHGLLSPTLTLMDLSNLPHFQNIPGRQDAIDNAGRIGKKQFVVSLAVLFGVAMLSVVVRLAIRIFGRVPWRLDDGLVMIAAALLASGFATCLHNLDSLYLIEALNKGVAFPFQEELPMIQNLQKWATVTASIVWTSVYVVKFAFLYFFHTLVHGMPKRITRFYWATVGLTVIFWIYTVLNSVIICPHFGADAGKCSASPDQHVRSLVGNLLVAIIDIVCDTMIVAVPIVILKRSLMPIARKLSLAAMLCLSIAMIIIALIRLIGTITDTRPNGNGAAPAWATYWSVVEGCVSLTMTSVIVIRAVFIAKAIRESRPTRDSLWSRAGRRLLSTLRGPGSSASSKRSSPRASDDKQEVNPKPPKIATQALARNTLEGMGEFITGGNERYESLDGADDGAGYRLDDLERPVTPKDIGGRMS